MGTELIFRVSGVIQMVFQYTHWTQDILVECHDPEPFVWVVLMCLWILFKLV